MSKLDPTITHGGIVSYSTYSPWLDDNEFSAVHEVIKEYTLVDIYRCYELWYLLRKNKNLKGDVLEVGVWRGGTGCLMASALRDTHCTIYLADTFTGVVKPSENDTHYKGGEHSDTSIEIVKTLAGKLNLTNIQILQGIYPEKNALSRVPGTTLRMCHIDVDTFQSAKDIFIDVWPIVEPGGMVVFDDYGFWGCEGVTKLCNTLEITDGTFIHNLNGHQIIVKR